MSGDDRRDRRVAQNENLFREVNERLRELNESFETLLSEGAFVCECARIDCIEQLELTQAEYERIRSGARRFVVNPGHVAPEAERVIDELPNHWVVEKVGEAAAVAQALDPRS